MHKLLKHMRLNVVEPVLAVSCIQILGYPDGGGGYSMQMEEEDHDGDDEDDNDLPP